MGRGRPRLSTIKMSPSFDKYTSNRIKQLQYALGKGGLTEQYAQTVSPASSEDPLVTIRKQELALRGQDIQRKADEFDKKQDLDRERERNQRLVDQQRIDISEEALDDKTRIAEERIQAQKDIAVFNANNRRNKSG